MKYPLFIFLFFIAIQSAAQDCNCTESFQDLTSYVEKNYSLFNSKVSEKKGNTEIYKALKGSLADQAKMTVDGNCASIYRTYIDYFNDRHLRVTPKITALTQSTSSKRKILPLDSTAVFDKWNKQRPEDPLIGLWESESYRIVILQEEDPSKDRDYVALVLSSAGGTWEVGEIKMEITMGSETSYDVDYYMGNRDRKPASLKIIDELRLKITGLGGWRKVLPLKADQEILSWNVMKDDLSFQDLGDGNYYISIESFGGNMEAPVNDFVTKYHDKLIQANSLIIDVRNNGGGNDMTYYPLLPYIHTGPVTLPNLGFWLSEENNKLFNEWWNIEDLSEAELAELDDEDKKFLEALRTQTGVMLYTSEEIYSTDEIDTMYTAPRHVAIITNEWSASSAETFVYNCSQSDRVVTFGQNTAGVVDGFNGNDIFHDCFTLRYPTSVRTRKLEENAIDPHGIIPDVLLDKDKKDVIPFIINFFKQLD